MPKITIADHHAADAVSGLTRIALAAFSLLAANALRGQVASAPGTDPTAPVKLEKFIVTGSHIPLTETSAEALTFPVITIDRQQIEQRGLSSTAELLQQFSLSNAGSVPVSNSNSTFGAPGASAVSLRGLGPDATLVLVNSRRLASYPVGTNGTTSFVDLNTIPLHAIERIDLLKDGASALYGSDALAGVVNIIFKRGLAESVVTSGYGNTTRGDSSRFDASVFLGRASAAGSLNLGVFYSRRNAIFHHDRAYSAVAQFLSTSSSPGNFQVRRATVAEALGQPVAAPIPGVSNTSQLFFASTGPVDSATGAPAAGNQNSVNQGNLPATAYTFSTGRTSRFNYNEFAGSFPELDRRGLFLTWDRRLNQRVTLYGDAFFTRTAQFDELAPFATGAFTAIGRTTIVIPARTPNPILTPAETVAGSRTATPGAFNPFNPFNQDIAGGSTLRLAEFGNRTVRTRSEAFALTAGARAGISDRFDLDTSARYSRLNQTQVTRLISASRFLQILNAADPIFNPASPSYLGSRVPYNPFGYFRNAIPTNSAPVDYATYYTHEKNRSDNLDLGTTLSTSSLFQLPGGNVGFALGAGFLRDSIQQSPDSATQAGDVLGKAPTPVTSSSRQVGAAYLEAEVPLAGEKQHWRMVHSLSLNLAGRYEIFFSSHDQSLVPKIGLRWSPQSDDSLVVRTSWGRAFLEPSLFELFSSPLFGLGSFFDPATGQVANTINTVSRGNSRLTAETSSSFNTGFVWSPRGPLLKGFTCSVDLWRITRNGTPTRSFNETIKRALAKTLLPGESVIRDADGNLTQVNATYFNAGGKVARGVDLSASYSRPTAALGRFELSLAGTYLASFRSAAFPGAPSDELIDLEVPNSSGDDAYLRWKAFAHLGWRRKTVTLSLNAHYTAGFDDFTAAGDPRRVASRTTLDAQCAWQLTPEKSAAGRRIFSDLKLTLGATNLLDRDPPFVSSRGQSANNYPGTIYNSTGRFVYVNLAKRL